MENHYSKKAIAARITIYSFVIVLCFFAFRYATKYAWFGYKSKVVSGNFTVYSELPPEETARYAGACRLFTDYFNRSVLSFKGRKTRVYLFSNEKNYLEYCIKSGHTNSPFGFFSGEMGVLAVNLPGGAKTLGHELTHYALRSGGYEMPAWLEEGLANLFENFIIYFNNDSDYIVTFGYYTPWRFAELQALRDKGMAWPYMLGKHDSLDECFLLFIYKNGRLNAFIRNYISRKDTAGAIENAFGMKIDEVSEQWNDWISKSEENRNVNFLTDSRIFFSGAELAAFLRNNKAFYDRTENIYKIAP